jgi:hypothetical protein
MPLGTVGMDIKTAEGIGAATASLEGALEKKAYTKAMAQMAAMAKAKVGGFSLGKARNEKGKCGEALAKEDLIKDGYTDVMEVQNKSGHGVDLMGRNANGDVRVLEVKTTDGTTAPGLKGDQASMGGKDFTDSRLGRAANGEGHYKNSPEAIANGNKGLKWLDQAKQQGKTVEYKKHDVFIEDPKKGCIRKKDSESNPWEKKTPRSPRRRK